MNAWRLLCLVLLLPWSMAHGAQDERAVLEYRAPAANAAPRRIGGSTRGVPPSLPSVIALVPDHLGLTMREQPTLFWYLSQATAAPIEIVVIEPGIESPVLELVLTGGARGLQRVELSTHGVRLRPGVEYEWSVALIAHPEQRSRDIVSGGAIMRVETQAVPIPGDHWYDMLMALDRAQEKAPADATIPARRAALLDQVGLNEVALFERRQ